jgi:hypothetical protein
MSQNFESLLSVPMVTQEDADQDLLENQDDDSDSELLSTDARTSFAQYYWQLPHETPKMYERLGVKTVKRWLPTTGDMMRRRFGIRAGGLVEGDRHTQLEGVISMTKVCEMIHLGGIALLGAEQYAQTQLIGNSVPSNVVFGIAQVAINVLPIMVQRYNRMRASRALDHLGLVEAKTERSSVDTSVAQAKLE